MTLKQLEAFYLAATLGSFALAAQRIHVTQSSLSKRIAELEASVEVGSELFDRSGKRPQLTEAGHRLLPLAAQMLEMKETIRGSLNNSPTLAGMCRFGISELGSLTWLPRFVAGVRAEHPELVLQPYVDLGRRLERQVVRGELDFAIVPGPAESPHVASHTVGDVRLAWISAPGRFTTRRVKAKELARHPVITMTEGSGLSRAVDAWAADQEVHMKRILASNSLMAIIGLTMADVGLSVLPQAFMRPWIDSGALVELRSIPPLPTLRYCFLYRDDDRRAMLRVLLQHITGVAQYSTPVGLGRKTT